MAKIVLSFENKTIQEFELKRGSLSIGRDTNNDIHIDDRAVSKKHAKILTIFNESYIEDLGSTNGTFIDNNKIIGHALINGENILIGGYKLSYINEAVNTKKAAEG